MACSSFEDKENTIVEIGKLNRFNEGGLENKTDFRIWINYSLFEIEEMYSLKGDSLTYKFYSPEIGLDNYRMLKLKSDQKDLINSLLKSIKSWDAPNDCKYGQEIGDGTEVILEYKDGSEYRYRKRNLTEKGLEEELYSLVGSDSVELKNLWMLLDELEKIMG